MATILDDGTELRFGQDQQEVERIFSRAAVNRPVRILRPGIDMFLETESLELRFDTGRLREMKFRAQYGFGRPLTPYPEDWKNFPVIDGRKVRQKMPHPDFLDYIAAWQERAVSLGAEKVEMEKLETENVEWCGNLTATQYTIGEACVEHWHAVFVNLGPSRRTSKGGLWCDGWMATFDPDSEPRVLKELSAFRDEFNTIARGVVPDHADK